MRWATCATRGADQMSKGRLFNPVIGCYAYLVYPGSSSTREGHCNVNEPYRWINGTLLLLDFVQPALHQGIIGENGYHTAPEGDRPRRPLYRRQWLWELHEGSLSEYTIFSTP